jgi:hypothetical protein
VSPLTLHAATVFAACVHRRHPRPTCQASGWALAEGATDGHGHCSCPVCQTSVDVTALSGHAVLVVNHPERSAT